MRRLLTAAEVAAGLNEAITAYTVEQARRAGQLASVKVGRQHFHTEDQVDAWLHTVSTTTPLLTQRSARLRAS